MSRTVIDVLEAVANDIDIMRNTTTEFANIGEAYQNNNLLNLICFVITI